MRPRRTSEKQKPFSPRHMDTTLCHRLSVRALRKLHQLSLSRQPPAELQGKVPTYLMDDYVLWYCPCPIQKARHVTFTPTSCNYRSRYQFLYFQLWPNSTYICSSLGLIWGALEPLPVTSFVQKSNNVTRLLTVLIRWTTADLTAKSRNRSSPNKLQQIVTL